MSLAGLTARRGKLEKGKPTEFGRDVKGGDSFEGPWCGYMSNNREGLSQRGEGGSVCLRARACVRACRICMAHDRANGVVL